MMKKKTAALIKFINGLHEFIITNPQFRKDTKNKSEVFIQAEIRPLIIQYLENYFKSKGYKDHSLKANKSFYWEGQEGSFGKKRAMTFASRNYPDFIIKKPYLIAVEYKQSGNGSLVKQAIGQSMMHAMSKDFDYVYVLFHDENKDKRIEKSIENKPEARILKKIWDEFNVFVKFI
tara:strand:- start:31 stop:558 length:528 start_codon:yes stop_codon:yes gene_type:complete